MTAPIDLRSDTVTRPSPEMRAAMAAAPVGDDQYGEDPTTNRLQEHVAALLGKEAALWLPSGTMANQVALRVLTRPGDDVIVSRESHAVWHETGGSAANAGVQLTEIGARGVFSAAEFVAAVKPRDHGIYPPTTLVEIENTHNRAGGVVFAQDEAERICAAARERGIATLSRRRPASGTRRSRPVSASTGSPRRSTWSRCRSPRDWARRAGRCSPARASSSPAALRHRRMLGGAMRQVGIFAAAALHGLEHHLAGLRDDHANARLLAERLAQSPRIVLDLGTVQTNIVVFALAPEAPDAAALVAAARGRGVWVNALGARTIRALTHRDVTRAQCAEAAEILVQSAEGRQGPAPA